MTWQTNPHTSVVHGQVFCPNPPYTPSHDDGVVARSLPRTALIMIGVKYHNHILDLASIELAAVRAGSNGARIRPAAAALEALLWPAGPVYPHCGCTGKTGKVKGKSARSGLYYCGDCKKRFAVTVGTIFERSKFCFRSGGSQFISCLQARRA